MLTDIIVKQQDIFMDLNMVDVKKRKDHLTVFIMVQNMILD